MDNDDLCDQTDSFDPMQLLEKQSKRQKRDDTRHSLSQIKSEQFDETDASGDLEASSAEDPTIESTRRPEADASVCWDFAAGHCPRGETCRFSHIHGTAKGYVFLCSSNTHPECGAAGVL